MVEQELANAHFQFLEMGILKLKDRNTVGPLCAGLVKDAAGWGTMSWALGLLGGLTSITTGLWCRGWIYKQDVRWRQEKELPVV